MKILNLYAGIGGNRKLWGDDHDITAVEWDKETAKVYSDYFPNDTVIVADAHEYLLEYFQWFDFIWASPPCPTHSRARYWGWQKKKPVYPDMSLYEEILLLQHSFKGKWVIENTIPYYDPLIPPSQKIGRHLFWSNFKIGNIDADDADIHQDGINDIADRFDYDLSDYNLSNPKKALRNCVSPKTGRYILDRAQDIIVKSDTEQTALSL